MLTCGGVARGGPAPAATQSIRSYVSCSGTSDDTSGATKAFAAAKNSAFTLVVDCPVRLHSGIAVDRGIFIDSGTSVEFTGNGRFIVDNLFHPAFVIADANHINLTRWNVVWDGVLPITGSTGGYEIDGKFVPAAAGTLTQPAGAFNDLVLTKWLAANRSVRFDGGQGWVKSIWVGGVNPAAVFFITGDSSDITFQDLRLTAPAGAGGDHFVPMAVSFSPNWKSNQAVNGKTPHSAQYAAVPHGVRFSGVFFDGTLMGWQGNVRDADFDNVESHRYGDLQDANNGNSGGYGKWYPPPHLFYLNYADQGDPALYNSNIHISNVRDIGPRVGVARDKGGTDGVSGYANSLKLGCTHCSVDNYTTARPDGFMDVLPSEDLTITNVKATYDSGFLNNVFPGLRFPAKGYRRVRFENVVLTDTADSPLKGPIGDAGNDGNDGVTFKNVKVILTRWSGAQPPTPKVAGKNNDVRIEYEIVSQQKKAVYRLGDDGHWTAETPSR
ncbi:MAG: hypothetical protein NVSMB10_12540 [Steroidobacteraceae bacterium]